MPGIVGLITAMPRQQAMEQLEQMVEALCHEPFYQAGIWADDRLGIYVGWVAPEGSFSGGMPLQTERGDLTLIFSGEEFPEPGTPARLKSRGHSLALTGPSYLVHLAEEDPAFPAGLNGRFHGLLVNRNRGVAMLFNDRYGMHRLYYHQAKDAFYFAAEAKAILAVCPATRRIDLRGMGEFAGSGCALENRTLFDGISLLPPGSAWLFQNHLLTQKSEYFHPKEWEQQETLDPESYYATFRDTFARNLPRYFAGEQPIAMSLTGGLDTRMIMAWHKANPGSFPCYTFGGPLRECKDVAVARRIAQVCGQPYQVIPAGNDFLDRFSHYAERAIYLTDGCVDASRAPDLYMNERARMFAPVRMTGNYGGEVLRCVRAFKPEAPAAGLFRPEFLQYIEEGAGVYGGLRKHPVSFAVFQQAPWHHYGILALEQTQLSMRSPFLDNDLVRTVFRAPQSVLASSVASQRLISDGDPSLARIPTDRGLGGDQSRWAEATSRGTLEFLFKAEYAFDMGMPQWLAKVNHALGPLSPERLFLGRHKVFHFRIWYRDVLANYIRETLLDPRSLSRSYLDRRAVEAMVQGHTKGKRNYTNSIHKLLGIELVHRRFIDSGAASNGVGAAGRRRPSKMMVSEPSPSR